LYKKDNKDNVNILYVFVNINFVTFVEKNGIHLIIIVNRKRKKILIRKKKEIIIIKEKKEIIKIKEKNKIIIKKE
jgi:hypothetical protein